MSKLIIIGGVAAGMSAAAKARRTNPTLDIQVYAEGEYFSYAGCGLPYFIGDKIKTVDALLARSLESFTSQNIKLKTQHLLNKIDTNKQSIEISDLQTGKAISDTYDKLIIATGARPILPPLDGKDLAGVFILRNVPHSVAIKDYIIKEKPKNAIIVGGGYIGLEMAENLLEHGCKVSIIECAPHIVPNMDEDMAEIVSNYLRKQGIEVLTNVSVDAFAGNSKVEKVLTSNGSLDCDLAIFSIGVAPNSEIAAQAGIELGIKNAIRINEKMETNIKNIYAAGDCATIKNLISGQETYIPSGTNANKQGKIAGENAAGGNSSLKGIVGTSITKALELEIARTGLSERECQTLGIDYISKNIKARTIAGYYPGSVDINIKIIAEKGSDRLLGGQIVGFQGSGKRIDILATALTLRASVKDLINMDLAYAPPFSPVWDSILVALNQFE